MLTRKVVALQGIWGGQGWGRTADLPISRPSPSKRLSYGIVGNQRFSRIQTH